MKVKWFGHSAFLITTKDGVRIITDPYQPGSYDGAVGYAPIKEEVDIAIMTHTHPDHNYPQQLKGGPAIVRGTGSHKERAIEFKGISSFHDKSKGKERGLNTMFVFEVEGMRLAHLGDLGHLLDSASLKSLGDVDVLFIPVGGHFTIEPEEATEIVEQLKPKIVFPMHYKTPVLGFPIKGVEEFLKGKPGVKRIGKEEVEIQKETLPEETEIYILEYAGK